MQFSAILTSIALLGATLSPSISSALAQGRDNTLADQAVMDMAQAYKQRDKRKLAALLPQARGSLLEPWAAYWEISARLDEAPVREIQEFMTRYSGSYQEDKLRNEWLLKMGRDRDWASFNREYPKFRMNDDRSVRCYGLLADYLSSGTDIKSQVQSTWLSLKDADEGCASAAEQLLKDHSVMAQVAWVRARLGMENDRLRVATQAVGLLNPSWVKTVNAIYLNPGKYLNDKLTALRPQTRELVSLALIRQAYLDPEEAAVEVEKLRWRAQLTKEERSWIYGVIGKRAAQKLSNDAPNYFAKAQVQHLHEDHLAWMARAALRTGRWNQVTEAIAAMPDSLRQDPTWVYWRARALMIQAQTESARAESLRLLESIASPRGFYEQLALEELGQRITTPPRPEPLTSEEREAARQNQGLARALYAIQIGMRSEGVREWNYSTNLHVRGGLDDRSMLAAADLACRAEVWDRCINSSERTKISTDQEQRFPMPFKAAVLARTKQIGLDPAFVYGLIRQESRFIMDAQSHVGASGLMQVMPATAKWTAKKIGLTDFRASDINDRDTNIAIGTGYLKLVLDNFGGSMPMAAAAYNAGPNRPRMWRGQDGAATLEGAIWAENVPFTETRDYVKKVLSNATNYAALITGQSQSLKARLGTVGPKESASPELGLDLP
ncbi:lytic transglycosylase domain-containing protein [Rhodoferax aquaticus]|uniref:Lytic transglycosylase domain-containing protein n=1 Tax=Rhodoferax aquaticus TaxID=2527691 RepID=A0A515ET95_9BURK|nr:lytic transglycosylase domain-containing protein [Rhodoferax aquaticus]QDL55895.1 lytic transglycosylase domain-containing protein [Rhodoferax aquaticus]